MHTQSLETIECLMSPIKGVISNELYEILKNRWLELSRPSDPIHTLIGSSAYLHLLSTIKYDEDIFPLLSSDAYHAFPLEDTIDIKMKPSIELPNLAYEVNLMPTYNFFNPDILDEEMEKLKTRFHDARNVMVLRHIDLEIRASVSNSKLGRRLERILPNVFYSPSDKVMRIFPLLSGYNLIARLDQLVRFIPPLIRINTLINKE